MAVEIQKLRCVPAFQHLSAHTLHELAQHTLLATQNPRHVFFEQGDTPYGIYILTSGYVKLYRQSKDRAQILALLAPGDFFGVEVLSELRSSYAAAAITPVETILLPTNALRALMTTHTDLRTVLLHLVMIQLRQLAGLVHNLAFRDVTSRLAAVLVRLAEIAGEKRTDGLYVPRLLTQTELAAMVGSAREVIHRIFKQLAAESILRITPHYIIILDPDRLTAIAQEETR